MQKPVAIGYVRGVLYGLAAVCIWAAFIVVSRLGVRTILNRGINFVGTGEGNVLSIGRSLVKEITDVLFTTQDSPFLSIPGLVDV